MIDNIFYLDRAKEKEDFLRAVEEMMDRVAELPAEEKNLLETWFAHVLEGKFGEKEQAFIRECFQKGEKKMISGFEQIVIEERENAKQEGLEQGASSERDHGIQVLVESCREFGQTEESAVRKLKEKYLLSTEQAQAYVKRYWTAD